jgi:hypothetical protein
VDADSVFLRAANGLGYGETYLARLLTQTRKHGTRDSAKSLLGIHEHQIGSYCVLLEDWTQQPTK